MRFAVSFYRALDVSDGSRMYADVGLRGVRAMILRAGSPHALGLVSEGRTGADDVRTGVLPPVTFSELRERPDALGWALVRRIYEAFGLWPHQMPWEIYDEERGIVRFPL
jgi:hypothetical protein